MAHAHSVARESDDRLPIAAAMTAFQQLAEVWGLSTDQQLQLLGSPGRSTFFKWKKDGGSLPRDTVERISHLLAIYKALQILMPERGRADDWISRPNAYFKGSSALDVMLNGQVVDILKVRQYLDVQRGG